MKIEDLPRDIVHACEKRGWDHESIEEATMEELFKEYCDWHGLIGWSFQLWKMVTGLQEANKK